MTFEEAIELLDNVEEAERREFTDQFGRIDEDSLEIENYRLWAKEVFKVISTLKETYAPKIKMTKLVYDWYKETLDNSGDFEAVLTARWEMPNSWEKGYSDVAYQIRSLDDKTLALAWLHPELIEVIDG